MRCNELHIICTLIKTHVSDCWHERGFGLKGDMGQRKQQQGVHSRRVRVRTYRIFAGQAVLVALLSTVLWLISGQAAAVSALAAGAVYLIPNIYFASRALKHQRGDTARKALAQLYVSEIWKMGMTVVLFAVVLQYVRPLSPFSLFGTYVLLHLTGWVAQVVLNNRFQKL